MMKNIFEMQRTYRSLFRVRKFLSDNNQWCADNRKKLFLCAGKVQRCHCTPHGMIPNTAFSND